MPHTVLRRVIEEICREFQELAGKRPETDGTKGVKSFGKIVSDLANIASGG